MMKQIFKNKIILYMFLILLTVTNWAGAARAADASAGLPPEEVLTVRQSEQGAAHAADASAGLPPEGVLTVRQGEQGAAREQFERDSPETRSHMQSWGFPHKEGVVLVLCGGGMKGLSHLGVFEVLEREKIPVAAIIGTSMGSIMGGLYASGRTPEDMREVLSKVDLMEIMSGRNRSDLINGYNKPAVPGDSLFSFTIDKNKNEQGRLGALNAKDLYAFLSDLTSHVSVTDFDHLPIPFAAVATNLGNGDTVILRNGNLASALRASMSIPVVFDPWPMNGMLLVDGGLKANLPVLEAKKIFPGHPIVAVNLSPEDITKKNENFRTMFDVAAQTLDILMVQQIRQNVEAADLVITPEVSGFSTFASGGYDKIIDKGVEAAEEKVPELKKLVEEKCHTWDHSRVERTRRYGPPVVAEVRFEGVPEGVAEGLHEKYEDWIGKPLDMRLVADTVTQISTRDDIKSVDGRTENISRGSVAVIFQIERPAKYEFGVDGYASNLYWNRWISLSAVVHDTLMAGDSASLEFRFGTTWGAMMRYFTVEDEKDSQWGLVLAGRREEYEPYNYGNAEFERYTAKAAWYKKLNGRLRVGLGYGAQRVTSLGNDTINDHGPYFTFSFNTLDDPILPTKGMVVMSDLWFPIDHNVVSNTQFRTYVPFLKMGKVIFAGGLKTGDADSLAYAAMLGTREELYSLGQHPLVGDQAYWLHLGIERVFTRSWWGGVNVEIFGNYGQTMYDWKNADSRWEVGAALSIPTNNFSSKLVFVYDDDGGFTIGYTIGVPRFWDGPLP